MPTRRALPRRLTITASTLAALAAASLTPVAITSAHATTPNPAPAAGARNGATRLPFTISAQTNLSVDVGTGNALVTDQLMTLPGINHDVPITLSWNSSMAGTQAPSAVTGSNGSGWSITGFDQRLVVNADSSVTYYGPQGLTGVFVLQTGSTTNYSSPGQFKASLVKNADGTYALTEHTSQNVLAFSTNGRLKTITDRNSNVTTFGYSGSNPANIRTTRNGPWSATTPTATITYTGGRITKITEAKGTSSRSVSVGYDSSTGALTSVTDLAGVPTYFTYGDGTAGSPNTDVAQIGGPTGALTVLTYGSGNQVAQVDQQNRPTASPGTSTTRITYPSGTQTLVADPSTDQGQAVSAVPHTTYTLNTADLVTGATDPDGHTRSAHYTPFGDADTSTTQATGSTAFAYPTGTNGGESLTGVTIQGGAADTAAYANTGKSQYLPSSATTDASNTLTYTYDGVGNQATTAQGTGPQAKVTYSTQGQPTTSLSPGAAATIKTTYTYDNTGSSPTYNLTSITPVTGSSLGSRAYTWDDYGRLKTATDGRGNTTTYTYDDLDRITYVHYSDATTHDMQYTYDNDSRVTDRLDIDTAKHTTYDWDDLGNLLDTTNQAGGGTETYTYDKTGALATKTDTLGTTTYTYDPAHLLTVVNYPQGSGTLNTRFGYDTAGRRTDVWLQANADHSTWSAREHTTYDTSGRVTAVLGQNGPATAPTTVVNQTACYNSTSAAPTCSTATTGDRHKLQWVKDTVSGETTTYGYDTNSRLHTATVTGGSNPRTYTYGYNSAGDRTSATVTGSSPSTQTLTYNNANQISTTGYTYDGAGNQTANPRNTAAFNTAGQQTTTTTGGVTTAYTYAGTNNNELLSESTPSQHTYKYVYGRTDTNGLPQVEQVGYDTNTAYITHDPTTGTPLMIQTSTGTTCLYMNDITSSPTLLSTSFQATSLTEQYDPYGANTETNVSGGTGAAQNPYLFHYGIQDRTTGTVKYGARWYDPTTGTWTQQDTLNAPLNPNNANRYLYAAGDPINITDPTGHDGWWDVIGIGFEVLGCGASIGLAAETGGFAIGVAVGVCGYAAEDSLEFIFG